MDFDKNTTYESNINVGRTVEVSCTHCSAKTKHTIYANYFLHYSDSVYSFDDYTDYQIIQCNGCSSIRFRKVSWDSENLEIDYDEDRRGDLNSIVRDVLYPPMRTDKNRLSDDEQEPLSDFLRHIYSETNDAIASELPLLAAAGLRAIIETICTDLINKEEEENKKENLKEYKVKINIERKNNEGNLEKKSVNLCEQSLSKKIDWIIDEGYLPKSSKDMLTTIKKFGNDSVHDIKQQSIKDLERALKVLETMIRTLYIHNEKFILKASGLS